MPSATIRLFLRHGDPKRIRTAEISNWSGKAIAAPRTDLDELLAREEAGQSAVYILTGNDPDTGRPMAYIGEAEVLRDRLRSHRAKDSWVSAIAFISKDENLTKAHIRYLEGQLIVEASATGRFDLENSASSGSRLPEADRHEMEEFLEKVRQLLPVLGSDLLTPIAERTVDFSIDLLTTSLKGLTASGRRTPNGFVVFRGSQAVLQDRPSALPWSIDKRRDLVAEGVLQPGNTAFVFQKDVEFSSPSAAGAIIHGGNVNGLTVWKNSAGRTLKEIEAD
ncbi:MAG: GIY-YIG nuclease family protein [Gemmatimonadales bacterium]